MPRVNLTDEEAALIERLRVKNTAATSFNEGLERALQLADAWTSTVNHEAGITDKDLIRLYETVRSERREVKL